MNLLFTAREGKTVQYMLERRSHEGMCRVRYCACAVNDTFITLTARLPTLFPLFCSTYSGSKSGPYRVILDRLSGQYREIWTGLRCRGLASCMTTVTCPVIDHYKVQEGYMNDPKQSTTLTEL